MPVPATDILRSADILRRHGATRIVLFGTALDAPEAARDLDLAVDGIEGWGFFRAAAEVEREVSVPVDLVPLSPPSRFTRHIERRGRLLYER